MKMKMEAVIQIGLKGDAIPLEAKVIKVADIYDAISSKRQYKPEIGRVEALKLVSKEVDNGKINAHIFNSLLDVVTDEIKQEDLSLNEIESLNYMKK